MWRYADQLIDAFVEQRRVRARRRLRRAVHPDGDRRPRGRARVRPRAVPRAAVDGARADCSTSRSSSSTSGSPSTSRTAGANPRGDVLTGLATATFPDGSTPEVKDAALIAANLFVGGQETTVRLLASRCGCSASGRTCRSCVRDDRDLIPNFIEETLRLESPLRTPVPDDPGAHEPRRRRHPSRRDGDARSRAPATATRGRSRTRTSSTSTAPTRASTSRSVTASTPAPARRLLGPRVASRSTASSTAPATSRSTRRSTGRPTHGRYDYLPTFFLRGLAEAPPGVHSAPESFCCARLGHDQLRLGHRVARRRTAVDRHHDPRDLSGAVARRGTRRRWRRPRAAPPARAAACTSAPAPCRRS